MGDEVAAYYLQAPQGSNYTWLINEPEGKVESISTNNENTFVFGLSNYPDGCTVSCEYTPKGKTTKTTAGPLAIPQSTQFVTQSALPAVPPVLIIWTPTLGTPPEKPGTLEVHMSVTGIPQGYCQQIGIIQEVSTDGGKTWHVDDGSFGRSDVSANRPFLVEVQSVNFIGITTMSFTDTPSMSPFQAIDYVVTYSGPNSTQGTILGAFNWVATMGGFTFMGYNGLYINSIFSWGPTNQAPPKSGIIT